MRALTELYAAILLFAAGIAVVSMLYPWLKAQVPRPEPPRPVRVLELNETHVVCYTPYTVNLTYWQAVGSFNCWLVPNITSNTLEPCPSIVPQGAYILVSPPWLCR